MSITAGAAAIMGGSALLSNIFGKMSQDSANSANYKIAQMNNEWSEKMMQKQMDYNTMMWNKQNEYNTPAAQRARLEAAGINPALAMSNIQTGQAQSASAPSLPSPSSATMQPYQYNFSGVADAVLGLVDVMKAQEELKGMQLSNEYYRRSMEDRLKEQYENMRSKKYDTDYRQMMESTRAATENEQYLTTLSNRLISEQNMKLLKQTEIMNDIQITHLDSRMQAEIALMIAQNENLSTPEFARELKFFEKRFGQKISKQDLKTIFEVWKQKKYSLEYDNPWSLISGGISGSINRFKNNR